MFIKGMYIYIKRKLFQLCGRLSADVFLFFLSFFFHFCPPSASCKVNARPWVRIINDCGQRCACSAEFCIIRFIFTSEIHFSCSVTLIVMPHLGGGHSSVLSTHARTKCATEIVLTSSGNAFLLWSAESDVIKRKPFTGFVQAGRDFFKCNQKKVHQKLRSKVSQLYSHSTVARLIGSS